jgi:hypothetical protein
MRFTFLLLIATIWISFSGCRPEKKPVKTTPEPSASESGPTFIEPPVIQKIVYVIDREGTRVKETPEEDSENLFEFEFGEKLEVVEDKGDWLGINYETNSSYDTVYVLKAATGGELDIPLDDEDLNEIYYPGQRNEEDPLTYDNIKVTLVSKAAFFAMQKTAREHFTADTQLVRKKNGTFSLNIGGKAKVFKDKPEAHEYNYLGQFKTLNKYLVQFVWYEAEDADYEFIDKATGKETASFPGFPYFSKDLKIALCVEENTADEYARLVAFQIGRDKADYYAEGSFRNWIPAQDGPRFWGSDNCFYVAVLPKIAAYYPGDEAHKNLPPDYNYRYIRIKILGPTEEKEEVITYIPESEMNYNLRLSDTVTVGGQIRNTDAFVKAIDANRTNFRQTKLSAENNSRVFWQGTEIKLIEAEDEQPTYVNRNRYYYHNQQCIFYTQLVTEKDTKKTAYDLKYYIFGQEIFAWKKFGRWISPSREEYEVVRTNIPRFAKEAATEALRK